MSVVEHGQKRICEWFKLIETSGLYMCVLKKTNRSSSLGRQERTNDRSIEQKNKQTKRNKKNKKKKTNKTKQDRKTCKQTNMQTNKQMNKLTTNKHTHVRAQARTTTQKI